MQRYRRASRRGVGLVGLQPPKDLIPAMQNIGNTPVFSVGLEHETKAEPQRRGGLCHVNVTPWAFFVSGRRILKALRHWPQLRYGRSLDMR